jgi:hypothetical protein
MARFSDALNRQMEDIKRPPPLPIGHYILSIPKMPSPPEPLSSNKGSFEKLTINLVTVAATDDVDPDELAEYGNPAGVQLRIDFIFNTDEAEVAKFEGTMFRLKSFMSHCGIDADGMTLGEAMTQLAGAQVIGEVKHRPDPQNAEIVYNEVARTAPV